MSDAPADLLHQWLARQVSSDAMAWLGEKQETLAAGEQRALFLAFGMAPRKVGKEDLDLSGEDLTAADLARAGWNPTGWSTDQAARTLLILSLPTADAGAYVALLDKLFTAAEVGEQVALYQSLPVLPHQEKYVLRAAEGIRTNMKSVFCAVAHRSPYPQEQFNEEQWNQMVLKSLFVGVSLDPIIDLDERSNPKLMSMLVDYAHERWSANRQVHPELWRPVGPYADKRAMSDLKRVLAEATELEQQAAALALSSCPSAEAKDILGAHPELERQIKNSEITWQGVAADGG